MTLIYKVKRTIDSGFLKLNLKNSWDLIIVSQSNQDFLMRKNSINKEYNDSLCFNAKIQVVILKINNYKSDQYKVEKKVIKVLKTLK